MILSKRKIILATAISMVAGNSVADNLEGDMTGLSLEQLLDVEVFTASKFSQKTSEAPSKVTVVDAVAIRKYGYRTMSEIMRSIPGVYTTYDRNYSYLGVRGFGVPGDYNTRVLMLLDGKRVNENIYDSFGTDYDGIVNVDLIKRVEFSAGPGSAIYGANAVFGVLNIITKSADDIDGVQISGDYGTEDSRRARITAGTVFDNDVELMVSASKYKSDGADLYYQEFDDPSTNNGTVNGLDDEEATNIFAKLKYEDWGLQVAYNGRKKGVPTASYEQEFNQSPSSTDDKVTLATLSYNPAIGDKSQINSSITYGHYTYDGDFSYDYPPPTVNRDKSKGDWINTELQYQTRQFDRQNIIVGVEYQNNTKQDQANFDVDTPDVYLDDKRDSDGFGLYVQDEVRLSDKLILNAGVRYDRNNVDDDSSNKKNMVSPRVALIYALQTETTLKLLYGAAYRNANAYELYYPETLGYLPSDNLKPEEIETIEFDIEHYFNNNFKASLSLYANETKDLIGVNIDSNGDLFFDNIDKVMAKGADVEAEYVSNSNLRLRVSYSYVDTENKTENTGLVNSPENMFKLNLTSPVIGDRADAGIEVHYLGDRKVPQGGSVGGYTVTNLTLSSRKLYDQLELSASIYNLFDRAYADPVSEEHVQKSIEQDGRTFRVKATYTF